MKARLTARFLETLKPRQGGPRHYEIHDTGFEGAAFGVRVSRDTGSILFFIRYAGPDGNRRRVTLGRFPGVSLADARAAARRMVADVAMGRDPAQDRRAYRDAPTVKDLADAYLNSPRFLGLSRETRREYKRVIEGELVGALGKSKASDIGLSHIAGILDRVQRRGAGVMANRVRSIASLLFAFGIERGMAATNPVSGLRRPVKETARDRVLSDDEIAALWKAADSDGLVVGSLVRFVLLTAQRSGETCLARWEHIEEGVWRLPAENTKPNRENLIPLSPQALALLEPLRPLSSGWVFPSPAVGGRPVRWLGSAVRRIREACGFHFTIHDLRRTAASGMADLGTPHEVLTKILNHKVGGGSVLAVYDRASRAEAVQRALFAWAAKVERIASGKPSKVTRIG